MKVNEHTKIIGKSVVLVPYKKSHVHKYHQWMQSEELRILTASEELTLDEEYKMQESWHVDDDKCTFIILDKKVLEESKSEIDAMIGDTNLFFLENDVAEAEIMIAESSFQGKGRGREAMLIMLKYGIDTLYVKEYIVKIGIHNTKSIKMFQNMGFTEVSKSEVFKEISMERKVTDDWKAWLHEKTFPLSLETYET